MEFTKEELDNEVLECARYGEAEDLLAILQAGGNVHHTDMAGNTALHRAAANGHADCVNILLDFGALQVPNENDNLPIHWAAQNGQPDALKALFDRCKDIDVLTRNKFGRSVLTEAFESKNDGVIELCLSHPSSAEDKIIPAADDNETEVTVSSESYEAANAVYHQFDFTMDGNSEHILKIRELPISRADNPFGSDTNPEDDTTGLGIWPASILTAKMAVAHSELLQNKVILELGAGCGVPALAAAKYCNPKNVYITDINTVAINNAVFNVDLNKIPSEAATAVKIVQSVTNQVPVDVLTLNWLDEATFPPEKIDVIIGSDLVYDHRVLSALTFAVSTLLVDGGHFLYIAPDENRDGMSEFIHAMSIGNIELIDRQPCPESYYANPIRDDNADDKFVLHFYDLPAKKKFSYYHFAKAAVAAPAASAAAAI